MGLATMSEVFFSFAGKDEDTVLPLTDLVEHSGFSVSHPGMISLGDSYLQRMNDEIASAKMCGRFLVHSSSGFDVGASRDAVRSKSLVLRLVLVAIDEQQSLVG